MSMKSFQAFIFFLLYFLSVQSAAGQNIFRFEHIGSANGLSHNTGHSILFDSKGFMWIGTWNGLNRFDGYEFKVFRTGSDNASNFTNNRVTRLWEDKRGFIWIETYDGYYHFFDPQTETFTTIPHYEGTEVNNGAMKFFLQYNDDIIVLGSAVWGVFYLRYDKAGNTYNITRYSEDSKSPIPDNSVKFINADSENNIWIGTQKGLTFINHTSIGVDKPVLENMFLNKAFTSFMEISRQIWFGTNGTGILIFDKDSRLAENINTENNRFLKSDHITSIYRNRTRNILVGFENAGIMITDSSAEKWENVPFHGSSLDQIYEDRYNQLWLTALEFGLTRYDPVRHLSKFYVMTPDEIKPLTDLERPQFFEDSQNHLWIGLHGSGLSLYKREKDSFEFFRNDPKDPNSISSNIVHCITEDKTGQLWLGTGQVLGGLEKVILNNSGFEHYLPEAERINILDNVTRALMEDNNKFLWVATKAGRIHLFDSTLRQVKTFIYLPGIEEKSVRNNSYVFFQDRRGYLWIGSKGYGLSVSTVPVKRKPLNYNELKFKRFEYQSADTLSIGNNNIYSICQDKDESIWIGTYGNGLSILKNPYSPVPEFIRINQENSNLSSNLIRHIMFDSSGNLWIATTFGLNFLSRELIEKGVYQFKVFLRNPSVETSLSYNDIIHIFEDSSGRIWFGTFGGGVDLLERIENQNAIFRHFGSEDNPGFGIIYGILEDNMKNIWLSTESGLTRLNPESGEKEIYNNFNGLGFNSFSENTCYKRSDGSLVFGGYLGFEVIRPDKLLSTTAETRVELTKFMLFNKEVSIGQKGSPLKKSISFSDNIELKFNQSSFTLDFTALDFLDPDQISYSYKLDNFESAWNNVGNQHRATYTNLSPGKYVFRVKAAGSDGKSPSAERILNIRIMSPWWETYPAYTLYLLIVITIIISIYKTITRINRYKNELIIEKKVNELKLQFFTNISHEIRTPLTLIIGPIEDLLSEKDINPQKKIQLEIMLKNAKRMLRLTNQLLDFRKVQNNKMVLHIREIDLISFSREIFKSFEPLARHKGITYSFDTQFDSLKIFADPAKLDTIIYNILSNAIKFTKSGKKVTVKIDNSPDGSFVDISVTDEGPGIPQKNLSEIFTRYTILSNQDLAGTGIGLSLSYELARLHKGDILISSTVGKGSTFTIRLLKGVNQFLTDSGIENDNSPSAEQFFLHSADFYGNLETDEDFPGTELSDKDIMLIVEDNNEILNYICQSLKSSFTCIGAKNGNEGLQLARKMNPDIIVTDIMMPGMDGMEMTKVLKQDLDTSHIPVIMLTAKTDMKDQIEGIETGAETYIVKPFNIEYLKTVATNLLNQRSKVLAWYLENKSVDRKTLNINSKDEEIIRKVVTYIEENYKTDFSIDDLSVFANVSRTVLYNKIKGLTGLSPIEFTRKIKLNIAADLLKKGYNVSEAAYNTGFTDPKYFSRLFKEQFGYTPSRYKSDTGIKS
jgi:signal transduction histidine kinase/ligand-binding sensor domain-containing protein/DNA-binding response OmpR family regulator